MTKGTAFYIFLPFSSSHLHTLNLTETQKRSLNLMKAPSNHLHLMLPVHSDEKYVALKVVKSATHYTETASDEIRLLEVIRDASPRDHYAEKIVRLLNHFTVRGVNGVHTCLVFEALGCSLYKLIVKNNFQGLAQQQVKSIIKQVRFVCRIVENRFKLFFFFKIGFTGLRLSSYEM